MDSGYYAACAGLRARTQTLELIANNVANINTVGYRGEQPMFRSLLMSSTAGQSEPLNRAINNFNVLESSHLDLSPGNLEPTGNLLDLAMEGNGFFAVQGKNGVVYTRNGNFQVSSKGELTTTSNEVVLGDQGTPLIVPGGPLSISSDGTISINGALVGKLRIVEFVPGSNPMPVGSGRYSAATTSVVPSPDSSVRQGMLESSNVSAVAAVTDLIAVQRHAEMLERAMSLFHSNLNHIAASDLPHV